jgi:hypothetical protein
MLSKTDFLLFLDAPMHLWAKSHDALEETSHTVYEQHLLQQGQQVEALAREFLERYISQTTPQGQLFWQPAFDDGQFEIRADALVYDAEAEVYDLYEIKSSTSVKTKHQYDLTFQVLLLEESLSIRRAFIVHINREYTLDNELDLKALFTVEDVSDNVDKRREDVRQWREDAWLVTQMDSPLPSFACTKPDTCPCPSLCHPRLPEHPIYDLPRIGKKALQLREQGITAIEDIPADFALNPKQARHAQAVRTHQPLVDLPAIQAALAALEYPLTFLDYETFGPAIPLFPGYRPYEQVVFQYSLYVVHSPSGEPRHEACLITEQTDPEPQLVEHLLQHLSPQGSVVVWNQRFERRCNENLARHCPNQAEALLGINDRLFDLMRPFSDGAYVEAGFRGSASLKAVLPVLYPQLDYGDLQIKDGQEAMLTWYWLQQGKVSEEDHDSFRSAMLDYCQRDTYGMVAIWAFLSHL